MIEDTRERPVETGWFWLSSRYYSPDLGRFIQPADVSSLNPSSINGLNLYSYANNNPIGITYSNSGVSGTTSGGMVGSTSGAIFSPIISGGENSGIKVVGTNILGGSSHRGLIGQKQIRLQ